MNVGALKDVQFQKLYRLKIICIFSTYVMYFDEDGRLKAIVTVEDVKSEISISDS